MNLASLSVYQEPSNDPKYSKVNWNQMSDRALPANFNISKITVVPSHGNSTRSSITRDRPGSMRPGGKGVDIKHGSYARYLGKLKTPDLVVSKSKTPPIYGNKTKNLSLINTKCEC